MKKNFILSISTILIFFSSNNIYAQNSMTGDGFGGRGWYVAHNYQVGAYSAYTVCDSNNQLYGWGSNAMGELGNGTNTPTSAPVLITGMSDIKFYTTGYISAAIKRDNTAWVWGNIAGINIPTQVLNNVKFVDGGASHVVFVKNDGTTWGAGNNLNGQLGNGSPSGNTITVPVQMTGINTAVRAIAVGVAPAATIILLADSTIKITGGGGWFQPANSTVPVTLSGLTNIIDIKGNAYAAYALNSTGEVFSFGINSLGLGPQTGNIVPPTRLSFPAGAAPIVALSSNNDGGSCLALDSNHNVYGWGDNGYGQLGDGANGYVYVPKLLATNVADIFAGETFSYILKTDNSLWATGVSAAGSIWMNLPNFQRNVFTQIDPTIAPMNLCTPRVFGVVPLQLSTIVQICSNQTYQLPSGATVSAAGIYIDTIRSQSFSDSIINTINVIVNAISSVNQVDSIEAGQTYTLPSGVNVTNTGIYQSVLISSIGCDSVITTELKLIKSIAPTCLLLNNAFTPNGDGINDYWILYKYNCFKKLDVNVYNRYGSLVYHGDDYKNDWGGTYRNQTLPDGTYYYIINVSNFDDTKYVYRDNVTIMR